MPLPKNLGNDQLAAAPNSRLAEFWIGCSFSLALFAKPSPFAQAKAQQWLGWLPKSCHQKTATGFTLAELLISLAILGVIATFTIPKIMMSQQNAQNNAIALEAAGAVSQAYIQAQAAGIIDANSSVATLTPYMNYVTYDTSSQYDNYQTAGTLTCNGTSRKCLRLHNGAILEYGNGPGFGGTGTTAATWFHVDPDGQVTDGTTNGPGKSVEFWLYYTGKLRTRGTIDAGTGNSGSTFNPAPAVDPPWFSW